MATRAEQLAARYTRLAIATTPCGDRVADSDALQNALSALERFIPEVLAEIDDRWTFESLDGILPYIAPRKVGEREIEIIGRCIVLSTQRNEPIRLRMQIAESEDEVNWLECELGDEESSDRDPLRRLERTIDAWESGLAAIRWRYRVTFGER